MTTAINAIRYRVSTFDWHWDWLLVAFAAVYVILIVRGTIVVQIVFVALLLIWVVSEIIMRVNPPYIELRPESVRLSLGCGPGREFSYGDIVGISVARMAPGGLGSNLSLFFRLPGFPRIYFPSVSLLLRRPIGGLMFMPVPTPLVGTTIRIAVRDAEALAEALTARMKDA